MPELPLCPQLRHLNQDCKGDTFANLGVGSWSPDSVKPEGIQKHALSILSQKLEQYSKKDLEIRGAEKLHAHGTCFCSLMIGAPMKRVPGSTLGF